MNASTFKQVTDRILERLEISARIIVESGQQHVPMLFLLYSNQNDDPNKGPILLGEVVAFKMPAKPDRSAYIEAMAQDLLSNKQIVAYAMILEGWKRACDPTGIGAPQEVLSIVLQYRDGSSISRIYPILGGPGGRILDNAEEFIQEPNTDEGTMSNLFHYVEGTPRIGVTYEDLRDKGN